MITRRSTVRFLLLIAALPFPCMSLAAEPAGPERVTYMILAETVEPIMIVREGDPMAGGIMTEIVKLIFAGSDYEIEPRVLPWRRMKEQFRERDDWIVHGFPESFGADDNAELSERPIFPFNHSAVTLESRNLTVRTLEDLTDHTVILVENFQYPRLDDYLDKINDGDIATSVGVLRAFTPKGTLEMLRHGRGDVVIDWQARLVYNLESAGLDFEDVEFHDATAIVPTENIHLVFSSRQSASFRTFVNRRIQTLTESGELRKIVEKYYRPAVPPGF
jgi:hypothetical protein